MGIPAQQLQTTRRLRDPKIWDLEGTRTAQQLLEAFRCVSSRLPSGSSISTTYELDINVAQDKLKPLKHSQVKRCNLLVVPVQRCWRAGGSIGKVICLSGPCAGGRGGCSQCQLSGSFGTPNLTFGVYAQSCERLKFFNSIKLAEVTIRLRDKILNW